MDSDDDEEDSDEDDDDDGDDKYVFCFNIFVSSPLLSFTSECFLVLFVVMMMMKTIAMKV